ncbi:MAG: integrase arm-type DNA-binding domain-containing protein, partial [Gammaproteobacteria bacterium]|nr:integrase arm-type DNA-binding domain-containing protein [Gammaproteobacteria bacterium]
LNAKAIPNLPAGRHADGQGLYLMVQKRGTRSWTQVVRVDGKRLDLGLGSYPAVSLKEARRVATQNRALAKGGFDPRFQDGAGLTFAKANDEYLRWKRFPEPVANNRSSNQRYRWDYTMRKHVLPRIGAVPVAEVTTRQAAAIASAMIDTPSAAKFALSCVERVCQWAIDSGHREMANPASGAKRQINVPPVKHAKFLPVREVAGALAKVNASNSSPAVKLAVWFMALTAKRLCEVRRAQWEEIDLDAQTWTIPGRPNAKIKEDHLVPLSGAAMGVLRRAQELPQSHRVVFPNPRSADGVIPDATVRRMMWRTGIPASPHGFRSTFRTWAQERGENWEASEISLSHRVGNSVVASYARSDMAALRRGLMERYAEALGLPESVLAASVSASAEGGRCPLA